MARETTPNINQEKAKEYNRPAELFQLFLKGQTLYLTNYEQDVEFFDQNGNAQTYSSIGLRRSNIEHHIEGRANQVTLRLDNVDQTFSSFFEYDDFRNRKMVIWQVFLDKLNFPDKVEKFVGYMDAPAIDEKEISVVAYSILDIYDKRLPARLYGVECPWAFGDPETCGVNPPEQAGIVNSVSGDFLTLYLSEIAGSEDDYWAFGYIIIGDEGRKVMESGDGWVKVRLPFMSSPEGESYLLKAGCDKSIGEDFGCERWDNLEFYGGFLSVPETRGGDV